MGAIEPIPERVFARLLAPECAAHQPPLITLRPTTLHAAIGSLAIGGAERIVIDWATAAARSHRVRLIVLRRATPEWPFSPGSNSWPEFTAQPRAPCPSGTEPSPGIECVRLDGSHSPAALRREGERIAASGNPQVLCHLLTAAERDALRRGGARPIPVLHNARAGWLEPADALRTAPCSIAVSHAAAADLHAAGQRRVVVLHHLARARSAPADARRYWRTRWALPADAFVIGMIGGVKPQKAYPRALRILAGLLERREAWLVILGGPTGRDGLAAWNAVIEQSRRLEVAGQVRLPGFIPDAQRTLTAFDLVLNTSRYEGLSIATLEALACGLPVVASKVGGQGEIPAPGLHLLPYDAPIETWVEAIEHTVGLAVQKPKWSGFPSTRLWTLMHLPIAAAPRRGTLFVTANLDAGGAQRSLVNLATALAGRTRFEIAVCGNSSAAVFFRELAAAGIPVWRSADTRDAFDHAEAILRYSEQRALRTIVLWNVDSKVKLLLAKRLEHTPLRLIDVCPGDYAFEEMNATSEFQTWIAYSSQAYYARLDRLVLKYRGKPPAPANVRVIANGVHRTAPRLQHVTQPLRKIVVSGRIAPSKYLLEIVRAIEIVWRSRPDAELHLLGTTQPRHRSYAKELLVAVMGELDRRIFLHGPAFDAPRRLARFDLALVIGQHQGSPNAVLEALAAGLPVIANDSGGTREAVIDGRTGLLLADRDPATIAAALLRLLNDASLAERLARNGRKHVERNFSMRSMAASYRKLLG